MNEMIRWDMKACDMLRNATCDPNNIVFEAELMHHGSGEKMIAKVEDGKLIMSNLEVGNSRVPSTSMNSIIAKQSKVKDESYIKLNDLLVAAGFEITDENPDIDFSQMSKNDLIKLVE